MNTSQAVNQLEVYWREPVKETATRSLPGVGTRQDWTQRLALQRGMNLIESDRGAIYAQGPCQKQ